MNTYAELQSFVADFLARDDLTTQIRTFVRLAEQLTGDRPTVRARLDELAVREVRVLDRSKPLPRLHAGG